MTPLAIAKEQRQSMLTISITFYSMENNRRSTIIMNTKYDKNTLMKIGFDSFAHWELNGDKLKYTVRQELDLSALNKVKNVLYAFVCGDEVLYIGKTTRGIKKRLDDYCKPGGSRKTNKRCFDEIRTILGEKSIEILLFRHEGGHLHCGFAINLAAGLEDILILKFNPSWNQWGKGNDSQNTKRRV